MVKVTQKLGKMDSVQYIRENAAKKALEKLVEVSVSEKNRFLGVDLLSVTYEAELKRSEHYTLQNDPWLEAREDTLKVKVNIPDGANAYSLGIGCAGVSVRNTSNTYVDYHPIVFFQKISNP